MSATSFCHEIETIVASNEVPLLRTCSTCLPSVCISDMQEISDLEIGNMPRDEAHRKPFTAKGCGTCLGTAGPYPPSATICC